MRNFPRFARKCNRFLCFSLLSQKIDLNLKIFITFNYFFQYLELCRGNLELFPIKESCEMFVTPNFFFVSASQKFPGKQEIYLKGKTPQSGGRI